MFPMFEASACMLLLLCISPSECIPILWRLLHLCIWFSYYRAPCANIYDSLPLLDVLFVQLVSIAWILDWCLESSVDKLGHFGWCHCLQDFEGRGLLKFWGAIAMSLSKILQFYHHISPRSCAIVLALYDILLHSKLEILYLYWWFWLALPAVDYSHILQSTVWLMACVGLIPNATIILLPSMYCYVGDFAVPDLPAFLVCRLSPILLVPICDFSLRSPRGSCVSCLWSFWAPISVLRVLRKDKGA